ncbi:MAG: CoA transferase [Hyphomicrobiales bacterium]|nr:CoA transferase [Hyphomicrobiales bacterium]
MTDEKPLSGLRVLELARILAGPWTGQLLADLGADVVKVERAREGDDTRHWGPPFVESESGERLGAAYYYGCNRGKRCVEADFETETGRALVRRLAANADVVIENFKVGGLRKFGLDYEGLKKVRPDIVYCSITGFGQSGPYAPRAGYDFLIQGMGGIMHVTGQPDGPPTKVGVSIVDILTGLYAANAIQAALLRRARTGQGAYIDCALLDTSAAILGFQALNYFVGGLEGRRMGNAHPNVLPYDVYKASDGDIIIATGNDGQFRKLVAALGAPELADDARFTLMRDRAANRAAMDEALNALTSRLPRSELLSRFEAAGVPAGPINAIPDVFADPQIAFRGMKIETPNARAKGGATPGVRAPIMLDGAPVAAARHAPALGEHTQDVLTDPRWGG